MTIHHRHNSGQNLPLLPRYQRRQQPQPKQQQQPQQPCDPHDDETCKASRLYGSKTMRTRRGIWLLTLLLLTFGLTVLDMTSWGGAPSAVTLQLMLPLWRREERMTSSSSQSFPEEPIRQKTIIMTRSHRHERTNTPMSRRRRGADETMRSSPPSTHVKETSTGNQGNETTDKNAKQPTSTIGARSSVMATTTTAQSSSETNQAGTVPKADNFREESNNTKANVDHQEEEMLKADVEHQEEEVLNFEDLEILQMIGMGAFSVAAEVRLPAWIYDKHGYQPEEKFVMKMTADTTTMGREIEALTNINRHPDARKVGLERLVFAFSNMTNPWDCDGTGRGHPFPETFLRQDGNDPKEHLCRSSRMDVMVMRKVQHDKIFSEDRTIQQVASFMRSILIQMDVAHQMGVNNNDLTAVKNIYFDPYKGGRAILVDWNGGMMLPERHDPVSWPHWTLDANPPEYWAMRLFVPATETVVLHGVDVWQLGMTFVRILYSPCGWKLWNWDHARTVAFVQENLQALGDVDTFFPVNATLQVDLLPHAYQTPDPLPIATNKGFTPLLSLSTSSQVQQDCPANSSWFMDNDGVPVVKKRQALNLLQSMLRVDPRKRPPCRDLLRHAFFYKEDSTTELEDWKGVDATLPHWDGFHP